LRNTNWMTIGGVIGRVGDSSTVRFFRKVFGFFDTVLFVLKNKKSKKSTKTTQEERDRYETYETFITRITYNLTILYTPI
jgi:hypothetical protein